MTVWASAIGKALAQQGNRTAATECFQKGIDITSDMTHQLQLALAAAGVDYVVAPYATRFNSIALIHPAERLMENRRYLSGTRPTSSSRTCQWRA